MEARDAYITVLLTLFSTFVPALADTVYCGEGGEIRCTGYSPYCCYKSSGDIGCCFDNYYVYQLWWFWLIWVVVFFLIMACSAVCWRRRRRNYRYVVMANSEYPTYGTVVHSTPAVNPGPHPAAAPPQATAPLAPPSYTSKPPPYSG